MKMCRCCALRSNNTSTHQTLLPGSISEEDHVGLNHPEHPSTEVGAVVDSVVPAMAIFMVTTTALWAVSGLVLVAALAYMAIAWYLGLRAPG